MAFNRKAKLRDNIEAIRTVFTLDREQRTPTPEERAVLEKYCGFGGLKCILNPAKDLTDAVHWAKSDLDLFAPTVELHKLIRENSKDDTEYKRYVDSLKASILTAFYTPKEVPMYWWRYCTATAYSRRCCLNPLPDAVRSWIRLSSTIPMPI